MRRRVGVLALQGDFEAHERALTNAGAKAVSVRTPGDLETLDGLILPGGESTTMLKLLHREGLWEPLRNFGEDKPIFGTCAGVILLAREVTNPRQDSLNLMDISVERNAYGRQIDSSIEHLVPSREFIEATSAGDLEAVFIRAPVIRGTGPGTSTLIEFKANPVLLEAGRHLACTFHPELTIDSRVHRLFLKKL